MFEIETSTTTTSTEEGASSDVTMSSTEQLKKCQEQIKRLETENKVLHGRIRGYKTLGDLLQEAKEENKKLSEEKKRLIQKLDTCSSIGTSQLNSDFDNPDQSTGPNLTLNTDLKISTLTSGEKQEEPIVAMPTITERSVASNRDNTEDILEEMCGSVREVTAMQESIVDTQNDLSRSQPSKPSSKEVNISQNLELDSDRFEEPEYEKVGRQMAQKPSSMSSMSVISSGPDEKYNFPSLSSGTPHRGQDVRPKTYNDFDMKPSTSLHDSELSIQMQRMLQMQSSVGEPELAAKFRKMSEDIAKTEEDAKRFKNLAYTFAQENQKLKTSSTMEMKQLKNQNFELREENKRLLARIKRLEHARDDLPVNTPESLNSQTQVMDWVTVERPKGRSDLDNELFQQSASESLTGDMDSVMANVRELRKQNLELKEANQSWNKRWQELTKQWEVKVENMRAQVAQHKQEVTEMKKKEKQLQDDCEKMVQNAKSQAHEEESAKEDALNKLHQCNNQNRALTEQICELEMRLDTVVREKHNLEAEIGVLKSRYNGNPQAGKNGSQRSAEELKTEIDVLRQQLTVFEEDFDRERQDRAAAQSSRDELQTNLQRITQEKESLTRRNKLLEQRLKGHESTMQQTLQRNENLQSQIRELQNQNRRLMESSMQQFQGPMNQTFPVRYQPTFPMYTNQGMGGFAPQGQMGGAPFPPQSPQHAGYNQQFMPMNANAQQQVPFVNYGGGQPLMPAQTQSNPGHWTCQECTFSNIPSRTVCEMCGRIRRQTAFASTSSSTTEPVLMSRDVIHPPPLPQGRDVPDENADLVTDNGFFQ